MATKKLDGALVLRVLGPKLIHFTGVEYPVAVQPGQWLDIYVCGEPVSQGQAELRPLLRELSPGVELH